MNIERGDMGAVRWDFLLLLLLLVVGLISSAAKFSNGGRTSSFVRSANLSLDMPLDSDVFRVPPGYNAPQQVIFKSFFLILFYWNGLRLPIIHVYWILIIVIKVHITQGDHVGKAMLVSWVTPDEPGSNTVLYWAENTTLIKQAEGIVLSYKFFNYTSGYIHHCTVKDLEVCICCQIFSHFTWLTILV